MLSKGFLIALVIVAASFAPTIATDYVVGDDAGWKLDVDYTAWAHGKDFFVGDRLIFKYNTDYHNVAKVNGSVFQQCSAPDSNNILTSGNDTIPLAIPGKKWYLCSLYDHCSKGMKLVINVNSVVDGPVPAPAPAPIPGSWAPAPTPGTSGSPGFPLKSFAWVLAALIASSMIIMA